MGINKYGFFNTTQLHLPSVNTKGSFLIAMPPKMDTLKVLAGEYGANG
jgi:hypothetical protein